MGGRAGGPSVRAARADRCPAPTCPAGSGSPPRPSDRPTSSWPRSSRAGRACSPRNWSPRPRSAATRCRRSLGGRAAGWSRKTSVVPSTRSSPTSRPRRSPPPRSPRSTWPPSARVRTSWSRSSDPPWPPGCARISGSWRGWRRSWSGGSRSPRSPTRPPWSSCSPRPSPRSSTSASRPRTCSTSPRRSPNSASAATSSPARTPSWSPDGCWSWSGSTASSSTTWPA